MARDFGSEAPGLLGKVLQLQDEGFQWWLLVLRREVGARRHDLPIAYRATGLLSAAQHLFAPVIHADFRQVVAADQHPIVGRREQRRLEQALVVTQQVNGAEGALGPCRWVEQYQVILALLEAWIARQFLPATLSDRQARQLANRREVVGLHEFHGWQLWVEQTVFATDRQVALGEVQVAHLTRATGRRAQADAAGVGEQVEHALAGAVRLDPAAGVAQVQEQQRVLPGVAPTHAIIEAPFVANQVYQRGRLGAVHRVFTVDARVATGAVVVDQQQFQAHEQVDQLVQVQEVSCFQGLVETLHQQLWAVTVDSQAAGAFLAAMKQAVAVSALGVQLVDQVVAIIEGGAQRLIQGSHGARLAVNGARSLTAISAGLHQPHPPMGTLHRAIAIAQRSNGALRLTPARTICRCSGLWCCPSRLLAQSGSKSIPACIISAPKGLASVLGDGALSSRRNTSRLRSSHSSCGRMRAR